MRHIRPETEESLAMFQNTNKMLFFLYTDLFAYCIIKGIKIKKFW